MKDYTSQDVDLFNTSQTKRKGVNKSSFFIGSDAPDILQECNTKTTLINDKGGRELRTSISQSIKVHPIVFSNDN